MKTYSLPYSINDYLSIKVVNKVHLEEVFRSMNKYLNNIRSDQFSNINIYQFEGIVDKFINSCSVFDSNSSYERTKLNEVVRLMEGEIEVRRFLFWTFSKLKLDKTKLSFFDQKFQELNSALILYFNRIITHNKPESNSEDFDLFGFYRPSGTNTQDVIKLLKEAIELIENDKYLSAGVKTRIINYIRKCIDHLKSERPNYTRTFGMLKEIIIVLGAIGSLISGSISISSVEKAKEKIEAANQILEQDSINLSRPIIKKLFESTLDHEIKLINSNTVDKDSIDSNL